MAPVVRKRVRAPAVAMQALAFAAPAALCVAVRRSRARDVATCALQMWAYVAAYQTPHDDVERQRERVHVRYPIAVDRVLGLRELPTVRLQRTLARVGPDGPEWRAIDGLLVWTHWIWFLVPHTALAYILVRRPERFTRSAVMTYAVFDLGACVYWLLPTAPPWWAAERATAQTIPPIAGASPSVPATHEREADRARSEGAPGGAGPGNGAERPSEGSRGAFAEISDAPLVRRMMVEYGEDFWKEGWGPLFTTLEGNPLAAMPSLHVASSVIAAMLLWEVGPVEGAIAWGYAVALAFALVYLGEHYVVDLLGGVALTGAVYRFSPRAAPLLERAALAIERLEAQAHAKE
jgi:membrane-associated phospholipid phosphatase